MYGRFVPAGAKKETHSVNYFLRFEYFIVLIAVKKKKKKEGEEENENAAMYS